MKGNCFFPCCPSTQKMDIITSSRQQNSAPAIDKLPHSLLLQILSRLDDSADVARCRVASKEFNAVYPGLRSINLRCSKDWYTKASISQRIKPLNAVFLDLISNLETVESVCIDLERLTGFSLNRPHDGFSVTNGDVAKEWLPRVSASLKSLSVYDSYTQVNLNILPLISVHCNYLVDLKLKYACLSMNHLNPMPMLTSLTLEYIIRFEDENLNELNRCFPNLQLLKLVGVQGLIHPKIHLLNLKTCHVAICTYSPSLTIITPNLVTLHIEYRIPAVFSLNVEAPMLSHFHLSITSLHLFVGALTLHKFENLRTLWLSSLHIGCFLSKFPITKTVEDLTLHSENKAIPSAGDPEFTLGNVFAVFPNVSSLRINSAAWLDLECRLNPEGWDISDRWEGLKKLHAYLKLVDPSLTFSFVACVLDQCVGLSEVSLLIHGGVAPVVAIGFKSKCMARWPELKWKWGTWAEFMEDMWIADVISN